MTSRHDVRLRRLRQTGRQTDRQTKTKARFAHSAGLPTRQRRTGFGNASTTALSQPPADALSLQSAWQCGDLPSTLDQGPGARPIPPQVVGFGDASGGRYSTDSRYRRVGTAAIIMDFPGAELSDIENLTIQQLLDKTAHH